MKKAVVLIAGLALAGVVSADVVTTIAIDDDVAGGGGAGWTQIDGGAGNLTKDNLDAEANKLWGVSNKSNVDGMLYNAYSTLAGSLPSTIQAGTYTLALRIGNGNAFAFSGLNDISTGTNTDRGAVAGFFSTLVNDAEATKNNMYTEFNGVSGVTYTAPTEADPTDLSFTTWTFTWEIAEGSSVVGQDFYFGVYNRTGGDGTNGSTYGSAFFDDSTLSYAIPEPATLGLVVAFGGGILFIRRRLMI
jgi:hypothetical protein